MGQASAFDKVKGGKWDTPGSGEIILSYPSVYYGGYGGLMDPNGVIWSANPLLRWDTSKPLTGTNGDPDPAGFSIGPLASDKNWAGQSTPGSYGLCIDSQGNVWNTDAGGGTIVKYASDGTYLGAFPHGFSWAQGCVVDQNDHVWTANSLFGNTVEHLENDGTLLGTILVGSGPMGVAVDRAGKVWSTNANDSTLSRIDPSLNGGVG